MCSPNVQISSNLGTVLISVANSNLNGTGSMGQVVVAGSAGGAAGTPISSITVKATGNTTLGMVRLFIDNGVNKFLYREIMIPANNQTGVVPAFSTTINEPITLQPGYTLLASTENAENFNVIGVGKDIINCGC